MPRGKKYLRLKFNYLPSQSRIPRTYPVESWSFANTAKKSQSLKMILQVKIN